MEFVFGMLFIIQELDDEGGSFFKIVGACSACTRL